MGGTAGGVKLIIYARCANEAKFVRSEVDVFAIRESLIQDYRDFTSSFVQVRDKQIRAHVDKLMEAGHQWPDPWLSLNPNFAPGGTVPDLIVEGLLHQDNDPIFRKKHHETDQGRPLRLHQHQREAIATAREGRSYVLTTGTGSGKSLAYLVPIVDRVLRARADGSYRPGVKAIIVYPMNALANSQRRELEKFLCWGFPEGQPPVTFARYTGQESRDERREILKDPPDIILTNYVMLELVLTRHRERDRLIKAANGLWFLVLDELHTYRGRQGADVAFLVRRTRDACAADDLQCVGTSATMASGGDLAGQRAAVAQVATRLFGVSVGAEDVIGESLRRVTDASADVAESDVTRWADGAVAAGFEDLRADPLAAWVEWAFGLYEENGRLIRQKPRTRREVVEELAAPSRIRPSNPSRSSSVFRRRSNATSPPLKPNDCNSTSFQAMNNRPSSTRR